MGEHQDKQTGAKGKTAPPPVFDATDRDRMTELQLQNVAQLATMSVNAPNDVVREQHAKAAIALARAAVQAYGVDGKASAKFKKSLDAAYIQFETMIARLDVGALRTEAVQKLSTMRDAFTADGWKEPDSKTDATTRIRAAGNAGATVLDKTERIELGELHMQEARDHLVRGHQSFKGGHLGGMQHAARALQTASEVLHAIAGFQPTLTGTTATECKAVEAEFAKVIAVVAPSHRTHLTQFARYLDHIAAMTGRPAEWMGRAARGEAP